MSYVVAEPCVKCKYTDCVAVCPVDCFYEGENALVINPDECIDCGACVAECPVEAIYEESELRDKWHMYKSINAVFSGSSQIDDVDTEGWPAHLIANATVWPCITNQLEALSGAEEAAKQTNKLNDLSPKSGSSR